MDDLRSYISSTLDEIEAYYLNLAMFLNTDYEKIYNTPLEDLPPLMDSGSQLMNELINVRLKGETNIASPRYTHRALWDVSMDNDDVRKMSFYDGEACVLREIAKRLSFDDLKNRANLCVYSD